MAARASRTAPKKDNKHDAKADADLANAMLESMKDIAARKVAFNNKIKARWDREVASRAKELRMTMGAVKDFFEDHAIETGTDDDAVKKAQARRSQNLDTYHRLYRATHDGQQLSFLDLQEQAEKARIEAEEEAGTAESEEDGTGEED